MIVPPKPPLDFLASLSAARGATYFEKPGAASGDPMDKFLGSTQAEDIGRDDLSYFLDNPGRRYRMRTALASEHGNFPPLLAPETTRYVLAHQVMPGFVANCYVALPEPPVPPEELDDDVLELLFLRFVPHQDRANLRRMRSKYRKMSKGSTAASIRDGVGMPLTLKIR